MAEDHGPVHESEECERDYHLDLQVTESLRICRIAGRVTT